MIALWGALLGFLGAAFPEAMKIYRDRMDKAHELAILDRQMELQKSGQAAHLQAIEMQADTQRMEAIYTTYHTGVDWVDALNGTVRPVLAYAFFFLYAYVKCQQILMTPWLLWTEEDSAVFSGIISFYFGQRAMRQCREKR